MFPVSLGLIIRQRAPLLPFPRKIRWQMHAWLNGSPAVLRRFWLRCVLYFFFSAALYILNLFSVQMVQKISESLVGADLMKGSQCWMGSETLKLVWTLFQPIYFNQFIFQQEKEWRHRGIQSELYLHRFFNQSVNPHLCCAFHTITMQLGVL